MRKLVLAGGCFWGMEGLIAQRPGVVDTTVGYTGGDNSNPTYQFHPGHAEAIEITFDPDGTSYDELLDYFFSIHDPTTLNRQGNDIGRSYRSAIFYADDEQQTAAQSAIQRAAGHWDESIVTSLEKLTEFYPAEDYHQDYLQKNPGGYSCHWERY